MKELEKMESQHYQSYKSQSKQLKSEQVHNYCGGLNTKHSSPPSPAPHPLFLSSLAQSKELKSHRDTRKKVEKEELKRLKNSKPSKDAVKQKQEKLEEQRLEQEAGFVQHLQELYELAIQDLVRLQRNEMKELEMGYLNTEQACRRSEHLRLLPPLHTPPHASPPSPSSLCPQNVRTSYGRWRGDTSRRTTSCSSSKYGRPSTCSDIRCRNGIKWSALTSSSSSSLLTWSYLPLMKEYDQQMKLDTTRVEELTQQQLFESKQLPKRIKAEHKKQLAELKKQMKLRRSDADKAKLRMVRRNGVKANPVILFFLPYSWTRSLLTGRNRRRLPWMSVTRGRLK